MTTYSGNFSGTSFAGTWRGSLTVNISFSTNGNFSGTGTLTISHTDTSGFPVTPNLSASDTETVGGSTPSGLNVEFNLGTGWFDDFGGTFDATQSTITGTFFIDYTPTSQTFETTVTLSSGPPPPPPPPPPSPPVISSASQVGGGQPVSQQSSDAVAYNFVNGSAALLTAGVQIWQSRSAAAQAIVEETVPHFVSVVNDSGVINFRLAPTQTISEAAGGAFSTVGEALGIAGVAGTVGAEAYSAYYSYAQTGNWATPAQKASIELAAAMGTGLAGIVTGGAVEALGATALEMAGLLGVLGATTAAASTAPLVAGIVVGAAATFYLNNRAQALINTAYVSGTPAALSQLTRAGFWFSLNTDAIANGTASNGDASGFSESAVTTLAASSVSSSTSPFVYPFTSLPLTYASAPLQPEWTYNTDTNTFTWNDPATQGTLTQVLSQMGVRQLAAPLNLTGSNTVIMGGPMGDHLSVGSGGNDWIIGGSGSNLITSGPGTNVLDGGVGGVNTLDYSRAPSGVNVDLANSIAANGWGGADAFTDFQIINGSHLNDTFVAGPGRFTINGDGGRDSMFYSGAHYAYAFSHNPAGSLVVADLRPGAPDGTDTLNGLDQLRFTYGVVNTPYDFAGSGASDMLMRNNSTGAFEVYDISNNTLTNAYAMGAVGLNWQVAGFGDFIGNGTSDMLMRNTSTGALEVYDIANNALVGAASMGAVGLNWQVAGFGDFTGGGTSDMLMRNTSTGAFEVYDIANNALVGAAPMGAVGLNWQVAGFGDFASDGTTDMLLRNASTGAFEVYDISHNVLTTAFPMGAVGLNWQVVGFGDFGSNGASDMLMRNTSTGAFEVYDISGNTLTSAFPMGAVGLDWQVREIGSFNGDFTGDMLMQNTKTGALEVYDISGNTLIAAYSMGAVGLNWMSASGAAGAAGSGGQFDSTAHLVQAMAGLGGGRGTGESLNTAPLGAETSQQPLLTTPQHA